MARDRPSPYETRRGVRPCPASVCDQAIANYKSFCSARSPDLALFICDLAIANYRSRNDGMARDRPSPYETRRSLMRMMRRLVVMQPQQIYPKIIGDVPPD